MPANASEILQGTSRRVRTTIQDVLSGDTRQGYVQITAPGDSSLVLGVSTFEHSQPQAVVDTTHGEQTTVVSSCIRCGIEADRLMGCCLCKPVL